MKDFAIFLLILGIFLVVHAVYAEKYKRLAETPPVQYKFLPRDVYYDQFFTDQNSAYNSAMFAGDKKGLPSPIGS
jgi:hypothetical protein